MFSVSEASVAVITGGSSGIGLNAARALRDRGLNVYELSRRAENAEPGVTHLQADVTDETQVNAAVAEILRREGRIDILINNAGFGTCGCFLDTDPEKELSMLLVNVLAMHRLFKFVLKKMDRQGSGTILNVASSAGLLPAGPFMAGYYASKAYVVSLTRGVAEELREQHSPVYVCALCPGPVNTEFNDRADVVFALKGISPELCVEEAMRGMLRRKTIIVPSALMRAATTAQKLVPAPLLMPILARQQKRKLGR